MKLKMVYFLFKKELNNNIHKPSIDEIKEKTKNFVENLKGKIDDYKNQVIKSFYKKEKEKSSKKKKLDLLEMEKSLKNKNSDNLISLFSDNLKNLDEEFFQIKYNLLNTIFE